MYDQEQSIRRFALMIPSDIPDLKIHPLEDDKIFKVCLNCYQVYSLLTDYFNEIEDINNLVAKQGGSVKAHKRNFTSQTSMNSDKKLPPSRSSFSRGRNKLKSFDSSDSNSNVKFKRNPSILTNLSVTKLKSIQLSQKKAFLVSTIIDLKNKRSFIKPQITDETNIQSTQ